MLLRVQVAQAPVNPPIIFITSKEHENVGNKDFFHPLFCYVMIVNENDMLNMFLKIKPLVFLGFESEDAYVFILDFYVRLHKLGIDYHHGVEYVSFQLECVAKQ